jgi:hypothetical protein
MKRVPIAKLTRGQETAMVYFDDYDWEEESPDPIPPYIIEGDEDLVLDFNHFVFKSKDILYREHFPMAWSKACRIAYLFSTKNNIGFEDLLPEEYEALSKIPIKPGVHVY